MFFYVLYFQVSFIKKTEKDHQKIKKVQDSKLDL